jgi:hypothetical protein
MSASNSVTNGLERLKVEAACCEDGAVAYEEVTGRVLGTATTGHWAVENAWQDAATHGALA